MWSVAPYFCGRGRLYQPCLEFQTAFTRHRPRRWRLAVQEEPKADQQTKSHAVVSWLNARMRVKLHGESKAIHMSVENKAETPKEKEGSHYKQIKRICNTNFWLPLLSRTCGLWIRNENNCALLNKKCPTNVHTRPDSETRKCPWNHTELNISMNHLSTIIERTTFHWHLADDDDDVICDETKSNQIRVTLSSTL